MTFPGLNWGEYDVIMLSDIRNWALTAAFTNEPFLSVYYARGDFTFPLLFILILKMCWMFGVNASFYSRENRGWGHTACLRPPSF